MDSGWLEFLAGIREKYDDHSLVSDEVCPPKGWGLHDSRTTTQSRPYNSFW